jgi:hypothetical protein
MHCNMEGNDCESSRVARVPYQYYITLPRHVQVVMWWNPAPRQFGGHNEQPGLLTKIPHRILIIADAKRLNGISWLTRSKKLNKLLS